MPLEAFLAALEADTEARIARIRAEAEAEAARLRAAASRDEDDRAVDRERARAAALEADLEPVREAARRRVLEARHRLLDRVFEAAAAALGPAEAAPQHRDALRATLDAALACVAGPAVVRCRPEVAEAVRTLARDHPVRVEPDPGASPGLIVRAEDGSVTVDATLDARLRDLRPLVARDLLAALGGDR